MKNAKISTILFLTLILILFLHQAGQATSLGTAISYQGHLYDANYPANGQYDFQFRLYNDPNTETQLGNTIDINKLNVIDGYFTAELDFGSGVFDGNECWLEISVRPGELNDPCEYTMLSPRQKITPTPYALYAKMEQDTNTFVLFGAWVDKSTSYGAQQAATDGFVIAYGTMGNGNYIQGFTDSNADPTTLRAHIQNYGGIGSSGAYYIQTITMPVRKNDYWKILTNQSVITAYWIPFGH